MLSLEPDDVAKKAFSMGILSLMALVVLGIISMFIPVKEEVGGALFYTLIGSIAVHYFARRNKHYFDED